MASKKTYYIIGGTVLAAAIAAAVWYFFLRPAWTGVPCMKDWKEPKWEAFKNWVFETHEVIEDPNSKGNSGGNAEQKDDLEEFSDKYLRGLKEDLGGDDKKKKDKGKSDIEKRNDWVRWIKAAIQKPWYARDEVEKNDMCKLASQHLFRNIWEEKRAELGLDVNGAPLGDEEWTYQGPITCLKGKKYDEFRWIKDAWVELHVGLYQRDEKDYSKRYTSEKKAVDAALWLFNTAGDKKWAKSFGSDTHTIKTLCNRLKGLTEDGSSDSWFPDIIGRAESFKKYTHEHGWDEATLPEAMGAGWPGSYGPTTDYEYKFEGNPFDMSGGGDFDPSLGDTPDQGGSIQVN